MPKRSRLRKSAGKKRKRLGSIIVPFGDFDKDLTQDINDIAPFDSKRKGKVL